MPVLTDPTTGTQAQWTRDGAITITAAIPIKDFSGQEYVLPLRVRFSRRALRQIVHRSPEFLSSFPDFLKRTVLTDLLFLAEKAATLKSKDSLAEKARRLGLPSRPAPPSRFYGHAVQLGPTGASLPVTVSVYRKLPKTFPARLSSRAPGGRLLTFSRLPDFFIPSLTQLTSIVPALERTLSFWLLPFPPKTLLHPPRRGKKGWPLTRLLPAALFFARLFIDQTENEAEKERKAAERGRRSRRIRSGPATRQLERVQEILSEDPATRSSLVRAYEEDDRLYQAIGLVERCFDGAWEKYGVRLPLARRSPESFQAQCARVAPFRKFEADLKRDPESARRVLQTWEKRLLGQPGQAARDFGLL